MSFLGFTLLVLCIAALVFEKNCVFMEIYGKIGHIILTFLLGCATLYACASLPKPLALTTLARYETCENFRSFFTTLADVDEMMMTEEYISITDESKKQSFPSETHYLYSSYGIKVVYEAEVSEPTIIIDKGYHMKLLWPEDSKGETFSSFKIINQR